MTLGLHTVNIANPNLDWLRGVAPPTIAGLYIKQHLGDPGAAGTANPSATTTRRQATMNAASSGQITLNAMSGSYAITASETISNFSVWDTAGPTGGNFLFSGAWTTPRVVINGDTIVVSAFVVNNTPLAA